jgi:hypothetical protein
LGLPSRFGSAATGDCSCACGCVVANDVADDKSMLFDLPLVGIKGVIGVRGPACNIAVEELARDNGGRTIDVTDGGRGGIGVDGAPPMLLPPPPIVGGIILRNLRMLANANIDNNFC